MRVLVCGSHFYSDRDNVFATLDSELLSLYYHGDLVIIEGEAKGADMFAREWAEARNVKCEKFPADWNKYGRAAGPIRNKEMLDAKPDWVIAFHECIEDSKGTKNMIEQAEKAGIKVSLYGTDVKPH